MNWHELLKGLEDGSFFRAPGSFRGTEEVQLHSRLQWLPLLKTESVWRWLRQDGWAEAALRHNDPALKPALGMLLERHLLNLDTRLCPAALCEFWQWVTGTTGLTGRLASVWEDQVESLRATCAPGELSLEHIVAQEERFVKVLEAGAAVLQDAPGTVDWARRALDRLRARRAGGADGETVTDAWSRIVFAWEQGLPGDLRPALFTDLELQQQGGDEQGRVHPRVVFGRSFHETVKYIAERVGPDKFHRLHFRPPWERVKLGAGGEEKGLQLPDEQLTGESGGLALLLAQTLANRRAERQKAWYTLPPWVAVTAALDRKAGGKVLPVGAIEAKIGVLREEGVRVVILADDSAHLTAARGALSASHGIKLRTHPGRSPARLVDELIENRCAWTVDLSRYKAPLLTRRTFIVTAASVAATCLVGGAAAGKFLLSPGRAKTPAMERHKRVLLQKEAAAVSNYFAEHPGGWGSYFTRILRAKEIAQPPQRTSLRGLRILHDSKFFDSTDWVEVPRSDDIARAPIEPAYFTRVLRLQKLDGAPDYFTAEFNSSGFGVIPLPSRPTDKVFYRVKVMPESRARSHLTRTTYLLADISGLGNDGKEFELVLSAIWFNSAQDQRLRFDSSGRRVEYDWWGTRLAPGTAAADLAVELPANKSFERVRYAIRREDSLGLPRPVLEVREGDVLWGPRHSGGTYTEGPLSVWVIPCEEEEQENRQELLQLCGGAISQGQCLPTVVPLMACLRNRAWIYSIQWKWR